MRNKIRKVLFHILPFALFFADFPKINLTNFFGITSMNIELSALMVFLVAFVGFSIPEILKFIRRNIQQKSLIAAIIFLAYLSFSILWSLNKTRGILTAGIAWLIFASIINILEYVKQQKKNNLLHNLLVAGLGASAIAIIQMILDTAGVSRNYTQLCTGCVSQIFGFPHANGFFAEPQFFGNIIAILAIIANYLFIETKERKYLLYSAIFMTTLLLTLSRGAIYAYALSAITLGICQLAKRKFHTIKLAITGIVAILISLLAQSTMSQLSSTSDTFSDGIRKPIEQLTLGKIKLKDTSAPQTKTQENEQKDEANFNGYVEQSTDVRTLLNRASLETWKQHSVFGVGIGGAGQAIYNQFHNKQEDETSAEMSKWGLDTPKIITQNSYTEILLELGVIGAILLIILLVCIALDLRESKNRQLFALYTIFAASSTFFFSGITNAMHLYIIPAILKHKN